VQLAIELFAVAFFSSAFGSMVGLGGGFVLVPILRLVFGLAPAEAAGTSLALVVASSASSTVTYFMHERVHIKLGLLIAAGGLPGSILGAILVTHISPRLFDWILALLLIAVGTDFWWNRNHRAGGQHHRPIREIKGMSYRVAVIAGFAIGLFSSLFGLGGGIVLVPTLMYFSELPAHAIGATSSFGILLTSPVGLAVHWLEHNIDLAYLLPLVVGGLCGGPIGARLSLRLKSPQLLVVMAIALYVVAVSLIWKHLSL
jgi:uncharacterized membrane protein YfcA